MPVLLMGCSWDDLKPSGILGPSGEEHDSYHREIIGDSLLGIQKCDSIEDVK